MLLFYKQTYKDHNLFVFLQRENQIIYRIDILYDVCMQIIMNSLTLTQHLTTTFLKEQLLSFRVLDDHINTRINNNQYQLIKGLIKILN